MFSALRRHWVLVAILILALAMRLWGIGYGLPFRFVGDETSLVYGAVKMLQLKTLLPVLHADEFRTLYYPPVGSYLLLTPLLATLAVQFAVSGAADLQLFTQLTAVDPSVVYLAARTLAALAGALTVLVTYGIGQQVGGRRVGWAAAAWLATSFLHLQQSHFYRHWVLTTLAVATLLYLSLRIARGGRPADYRWAGVAAGLGFGVSYVPALALAVVGLAHWFSPGAPSPKLRSRPLWQGLAIFAALAALAVALHPQEFSRYSLGEGSGLGLGKSLAGFAGSLAFHLRNFWQLEPAMFIAAVAGCVWLGRASRRHFTLLAALPVLYLPVLYLLFHDEVRYLLVLLPSLAVFAAVAVDRAFHAAARFSPASAAAVAVLSWVLPLAVAGKYLQLLSVPDTRQLAVRWTQANLPAGSRVVADLVTFRLTPTRESLGQQQALDPSSLRQEDHALLKLPPRHYPQPAYEVLPLHFITQPRLDVTFTPEALARASFQYLVVEEGTAVRPETQALIASGVTVLQQFPTDLPDVNGNFERPIVSIFPTRRLGPTVTVYRLPATPPQP